jgi:hypothetical protein
MAIALLQGGLDDWRPEGGLPVQQRLFDKNCSTKTVPQKQRREIVSCTAILILARSGAPEPQRFACS